MKTIEDAARKCAGCPKGKGCGHDCKFFDEEMAYPCERYESFKEGVGFSQRWISVEDELPEHRQRVLFKSERFEYAGAGVYDYATFRDHDNNIVYDVTHWRPIELK